MADSDALPIFNLNGAIHYGTDDPRRQEIVSFESLDRLSETNSSIHGSVDNMTPASSDRGFVYRLYGLYERFERLFVRGEARKNLIREDSVDNPRRRLTWLSGVFAPVALGMFSTLLFIRTGFVVGQAGILETILQMFLAYIILMLTVFSICAISTNGAVEGGGAYYMISRALGPEFGGSIGFLFYVANVLACALYVAGFVEGMMENFGTGGYYVTTGGLPDGQWWRYLYSTVVLFLCLLVCMIGGSMFAKTLTVILGITVVCTLSVYISIFAQNKNIAVRIPKENHYAQDHGLNLTNNNITFNYTGLKAATFRENLYDGYTSDYQTGLIMNFSSVFAILFSSVTGIMNGANMSGELKDPSNSIPKGTLSAICFTFITYLTLAILVGGSCHRDLLVNNYIFLQDINLWPPFVLVGIFATTLSAALGNLIGGSRILEALATDQLFWIFLKPATLTTKGGNPFVAVLMTWVLVQLVLLVGSLNAIAPATSVFFLLSYASVNLACMALDMASAPNFRPTFKYFSWHTCFLGMIGCLTMCFLISSIYTSISIIAMLLLIIMLHFRSLPTSWGSISQALIFHQVRKYLLMLDIRKSHVKYWRPQILLMVARPRQCIELIDFINDIKKGGLYVLGHVKVGNLDAHPEKDPVMDEMPKWMKLVDKLMIKAFVEVILTNSVVEGMQHLVRNCGLGGMKTNTVCLGFYDDAAPVDSLSKRRIRKKGLFRTTETDTYINVSENYFSMREGQKDLVPKEYVKMIADSLKMQKNVLLCRHFNNLDKRQVLSNKGYHYIDVWPVNLFRPETASYFDNTCLFLLQLACILNMVPGWKSKTYLRVFLFVNSNTDNTANKEKKLKAFLRQLRILARIQIVSCESIPDSVWTHQFDVSVNYSDSRMQDFNEVNEDFLTAINKLIVSFSSQTAVTFLYLPRPPQDRTIWEKYLEQLTALTQDFPPTVLVHGLHPVTSTTL